MIYHLTNGGYVLAISEPFSQLLYRNQTNKHNIAVYLILQTSTYPFTKVKKAYPKHITSISKVINAKFYTSSLCYKDIGIDDVTKPDIAFINLFFVVILFIFSFLLGLKNTHQKTVKSMIEIGIRKKGVYPLLSTYY